MASISDNLSYIRTALSEEINRSRDAFVAELEARMKAQVTSGDGQPPYSSNPTWFNTTRIPAFAALLRERGNRDASGQFTRSKFGGVSIYLKGGYREFRQIVGRPVGKVDFVLTGEFVQALKARAVRQAGGGLHAWIGFEPNRRSYGKLSNRELAEALADRAEVDPFRIDEIGEELAQKIIDSALVRTGAV